METDTACDDPLTYLHRKPLRNFVREQLIYETPDHLYVSIQGRVKVTRHIGTGSEVVTVMVPAEGLFGESCLIGRGHAECAAALDNVTVMAWTREEIEQQIEREPRLGVALLRYLQSRSLRLQARVASLAVYATGERVGLSLVELAKELGNPIPDGSMRVSSLTHQTVAQYAGTSREIVTSQMNRLRRMGLIRYSRKHIDVYVLALEDELRHNGVTVPETQTLTRAG